MMPTGYSTLFSLGLSNIHSSVRCELSDALSPLPPNSSLCTPVSSTSSPDLASLCEKIRPTKLNVDTQVPPTRARMRRRRSSVTNSACPVKTPICASSNKIRSRRSDGDMITRSRRNGMIEPLRSRRGAVHTPAHAPPNVPLPPVPPLPSDGRASSYVPQATGEARKHRHVLSEQELPTFAESMYLAACGLALAAASPSLCTTKRTHTLVTPPASPMLAPTSPVDPVLGSRSYFEPFTPSDEAMLVN